MLKKILSTILAIITMLSVMSTSVFADTEYMPKGIKATQKQYEDLISVAIEKSEYEDGKIDKEHIFIIEHTSPLQMKKNEKAIWLYAALPIADSSDISYAHFENNEYISAVTNFVALKGTEKPYGDNFRTYIEENNLSEPTGITNLWVGERVHIFAHKVICDKKEYIIPYYLTDDSIFKHIKNEDCNIEIGKAYTLDEFLTVCETAANLFDEQRKSENKKDKSETFTDDNGDEITTNPKETEIPKEADITKYDEEKTDNVTYAVAPTEKWDFADGDFTESLNAVSSAYSSKYFSAKANKKYYLSVSNLYNTEQTATVKFMVMNKNNGTTANDENYTKMVYSITTDGKGGFTAPMNFGDDTDFYLELTTSNPQSAKVSGTYTIRETDISYFNDISGHWAESTINKWANKGIISGYPDGTFKPDSPVTRAELAKILTLAFDLRKKSGIIYDDISAEDWYYPYLECCAEYIPNYPLPVSYDNNIPYQTINEKGLNYFLPETSAMRMHVAEAAAELKKAKFNLTVDVPDIVAIKDDLNKSFKDDDYENLYAMHGKIPTNVRRMFEYTYIAKELDIMLGDTDGYFRPYDNVTRAELITMLDRIIGQ